MAYERNPPRLIVGADDGCDIVVRLPAVSRRHCAVTPTETTAAYLIEDLGSSNGTYINGRRLTTGERATTADIVTLGSSARLDWHVVYTLARRDAAVGTESYTIGRLPSNDIVIDAPQVSGRHARLVVENGRPYIEDLGGRNGLFAGSDRRRVTRQLVEPGDFFYLGSYEVPASRLLGHLQQAGAAGGPAGSRLRIDLRGRDGVYVIGRSSSCDLRLDYPMISGRHARLTVAGDKATVADMGSANGTFVNGVRIERPTPIAPGDSIGLGSYSFLVGVDGLSLTRRDRRGDVMLEVRNVGVQVPGKRLLDDVSLVILPGELVGLMGPSGAGKSTLIAALNGYVAPTEGVVSISGVDLYAHYDEFRGQIGYVPQDDIMHADLTVREALYYSARLRLPADFTDAEIRDRMGCVLGQLGLEGTENIRIGNAERRGISGGQRKRVSVAMELLTDPPLLFLDEPTSGLSSEDALALMRLLRSLADAGKTVVLTIHQPSVDVFKLMDNLIVVGKDAGGAAVGKVVYYGPAYPDAITFFEPRASRQKGEEQPQSADGVLRGLATRPASEWESRFRQSDSWQVFVARRLKGAGPPSGKAVRRRPAHGGGQFMTLVRRGMKVKTKDVWNTGILLAQAPLIAVLVGLVFGEKLSTTVTLESFAGVASATAMTMFLIGISAIWFGCSNAAREIVAERAIYRRERMAGLGIPSYIASKMVVLGVVCGFQCVVLLVVIAVLGQIDGSWTTLYASTLCASLAGVVIGLLVSAAAPTAEVAAAVLPLVILPMVILGGILLPLPDLPEKPVPIVSLAQAMPSRWAFEALLLEEAASRPAILRQSPPRLIPADDRAGRSGENLDKLTDFAEKVLPSGDESWRNGPLVASMILLGQAVVGLLAIGFVLKRRDIR
jgi:ABC-type multidrug transport system ATPase subunit/pSer/pThr/pTyr-binding forkhead associated (FHA) protein